MAIHDEYLRRTPFERFLPDPGFPDRHFAAIGDEARERGMALDDPGAFALLESATAALDEVRRPDDAPETLAQHALVLFHAYHFERAGQRAYLVDQALVRTLTGTEPWQVAEHGAAARTAGSAESPDDRPWPDSVYVQLPQHLVWANAEGQAPASMDGFFRTVTGSGHVHLLPVVGLLEGSSGFTVLPLPGLPQTDAPTWATAPMRQDGDDFASDLPGGDLEGLIEVRTAGEVLKLAARLEDWVVHMPGVQSPAASIATDDDRRPAPSILAASRIGVSPKA
jgi:hypothetical protein